MAEEATSSSDGVVAETFRALVESGEKKFARVRDAPSYVRGPYNHYFHSVFKAYMRLWKYQQENRVKLMRSGLQRWEIGEIASRIGQLYFNQYMRTSKARFLIEAYVFYEAILSRRYFEEGSKKDKSTRFKELRFYVRFFMVSLILNRAEMVKLLMEKFRALVEDTKSTFADTTNFKEWRLVLHEMIRFTKADAAFLVIRPLRYSASFDSHPSSLPYIARFNAKKVLRFQDALLTGYHKNEVKFADISLDIYRMVQCLEWEPSGSFYEKHQDESQENGSLVDHSAASGLIEINLTADMSDTSLPPNPRKAILHRPSVTQLIAAIATICEELPLDSVMLIYISVPGSPSHTIYAQGESSESSGKSSKFSSGSHPYKEKDNDNIVKLVNGKRDSNQCFDSCLWLGPSRDGGPNNLYPGDFIPFTRKPLFLILDSDNSHAFKAVDSYSSSNGMITIPVPGLELVIYREVLARNSSNLTDLICNSSCKVLHGAEREEMTALFLSPLRPSFKDSTIAGLIKSGSQFTLFLTAPLQAFCQLVGLTSSDFDKDVYGDADSIISSTFSEWEVILCTSTSLNLVWAQILTDHLLRRLILRFIFCRAVLTSFCVRESSDKYLPICLPEFPDSLSPYSKAVISVVKRLADILKVTGCFRFYGV